MPITYRDTHDFSENDLERLFLSVEWSSGHFPEKLAAAIRSGDRRTHRRRRMAQAEVLMSTKKLRIAVIAYDEEMHFYEQCGFRKADHASPMFITSLWT